jgi:hypothetical protein
VRHHNPGGALRFQSEKPNDVDQKREQRGVDERRGLEAHLERRPQHIGLKRVKGGSADGETRGGQKAGAEVGRERDFGERLSQNAEGDRGRNR